MRPRKRKHPNYKAYFVHQLQVMQEKFPFLSSQQIKSKILSTWDGFSPEKKNDWGSPPMARHNNGNSSQYSDGTEVSPFYRSPPPNHKTYHTQEISPHPKGSNKKVRFSKPISDIQTIIPFQETPMENSETSTETSETSLPDIKDWPISDEFDCISKHALVVEQETKGEESDCSHDDEHMLEERNVWPSLFGDTSSIWKEFRTKQSKENKEQPMCGLFQKIEPGKRFPKRRILKSLSPSEKSSTTDIFEGDQDHDIFA